MAASIALNAMFIVLMCTLADGVGGSRGYLTVQPGDNKYFADTSDVIGLGMPLLRKLEDPVVFDVYMFDNILFKKNQTFQVYDEEGNDRYLQGYKVMFSKYEPESGQHRIILSFMFTLEEEYLEFRSQLTRIIDRMVLA